MHDFKTGYLKLSSLRSTFVSQVIGVAMGYIVAPLNSQIFYISFDVGNPNGQYKAPYALVYRNMAIMGMEGFGALRALCLQICYGAFSFAFLINGVRNWVPKNVSQYITLPMAMAIPFLVGAYFSIDMCVGIAIVFVWQQLNCRKVDMFVLTVASGLMCGDGIWILPASILDLTKVKPHMCIKFLSIT